VFLGLINGNINGNREMKKNGLRNSIIRAIPVVEKSFGLRIRITTPGTLHTLIERECLNKVINYFGVDCIFDVGANKGQYAQRLRREVGFKGDIISFEPIPECAAHVRYLAQKDPRWFVEEVALSDFVGTVKFNIMADSEFSSLLSPNNKNMQFENLNKITQELDVVSDTIEKMYEKYGGILNFKKPYLKMDTQGNDLNVAKGAADKLQCFVAIQSELSVVKIYDDSPGYMDMIQFYESKGFRLSAFIPNNGGHFPRLVETDCVMYNESFLDRPSD